MNGGGVVRDLFAAMRPRQWGKNLLVVVAPLVGGRLLVDGVALRLVGAFAVFVLASSATYLLNDVVDRERDAAHPVKRDRPIASGRLPVSSAVLATVVLAGVAVGGAVLLGPIGFPAIITGYLVLTGLYSVRLKHEPLFDIVVIAAGFLLRAAAGGVATSTPLSAWFLVTATFGALFVAAGKRASEHANPDITGGVTRPSLLGYSPGYLRFVWTLSATVTIAAAALWAIEVAGGEGVARPVAAQASIGPLALGILRYGLWIDRGQAEAPEHVIRRDPALILLGLFWAALVFVGSGGAA